MAQAIVSPDNPLTARVMVNRLWCYHFGQGLVSTPSSPFKKFLPGLNKYQSRAS